MEKAVRRIGVFTSGGDAPGMNAAIRAVVRTSLHMGIECVGIRRGYHGLINGDFTKLTFESVSDLSRRGGTMLYSARSEEFKTPAGQERAVATCKMLGLDALVGIGGDGTFSGLLCLAKRGLSVVGIPGTIDNDIACSSYTIGYDTACNTALESIDKLRDTMQSHERCSVVEVMGHRAGHLALTVGVACGATAVIVPEHPVDYEADLLEPIRPLHDHRGRGRRGRRLLHRQGHRGGYRPGYPCHCAGTHPAGRLPLLPRPDHRYLHGL